MLTAVSCPSVPDCPECGRDDRLCCHAEVGRLLRADYCVGARCAMLRVPTRGSARLAIFPSKRMRRDVVLNLRTRGPLWRLAQSVDAQLFPQSRPTAPSVSCAGYSVVKMSRSSASSD